PRRGRRHVEDLSPDIGEEKHLARLFYDRAEEGFAFPQRLLGPSSLGDFGFEVRVGLCEIPRPFLNELFDMPGPAYSDKQVTRKKSGNREAKDQCSPRVPAPLIREIRTCR